ncbi:hypothetical protein ACFJGW_18065 [Burkholderiaceae bacterium UC74_6]
MTAAKKQKTSNTNSNVTQQAPNPGVRTRASYSMPIFGDEHAHDHTLHHGTREQQTFHAVTTKEFKSKQAYDTHRQETGLTIPHPDNPRAHLSRRGSVGEFEPRKGGKVDTLRISSAATSRVLEASKTKRSRDVYEAEADRIQGGVTNSVGKRTTTNVVESEAFSFSHTNQGFKFTAPPQFAQGTSATGLTSDQSPKQREHLYRKSTQTAKKGGFKPSASSHYHSEPHALGLMPQPNNNSVLMTTSSPNDMCVNCGRTYADQLNATNTVSAMGGVPFGGQKPGFDGFTRKNDMSSLQQGAAVYRAEPLSTLRSKTIKQGGSSMDTLNMKEVEALRQSGRTFLHWK